MKIPVQRWYAYMFASIGAAVLILLLLLEFVNYLLMRKVYRLFPLDDEAFVWVPGLGSITTFVFAVVFLITAIIATKKLLRNQDGARSWARFQSGLTLLLGLGLIFWSLLFVPVEYAFSLYLSSLGLIVFGIYGLKIFKQEVIA